MEEPKNSITFDLTMPSGTSALFTLREEGIAKAKALLTLAIAMDKTFTEQGIKPHVKSFGGGGAAFVKKEKEWTGESCPKCTGRLYFKDTKNGKAISCENGKWDFATKQAVGCTYFKYVNTPQPEF